MDFSAFFRSKLVKKIGIGIGVVLLILCAVYAFQIRAPRTFQKNAIVVIGDGKGLAEIANELKKQHIIRSTFWFTNFVIMLKHERAVVGGEYYFEKPVSVYEVARRIGLGQFNIEQLKTTIPEGSTVFDIGDALKKNYPDFDEPKFISLAREKEGFLFPDTYKFGANVKPEKVISVMTSTFNKRVEQGDAETAIKVFGKPLKDVITMASILEGEARQFETRRMIAGILWERLRRGIPLQVDAAFRYINGKTSAELTLTDLKIDSPYNTYVHAGFPPTPISNPGLDSIVAAVTPIKSKYLYFLTDKNGVMHYAETLDEHAANKARYLK